MKDFTTRKITMGMLFLIMVLSIFCSTGAFAANVDISDDTTIENVVETDADTPTDEIGVAYRGHVENIGDMPVGETNFITGPNAFGTRAQSLRVEGFMIKLTDNVPVNANIVYEVYVQNEGWMKPVKNGAFAGTRGECQRVESIKINLENLPGYDVYYRGHVQGRGNTPQVDGEWDWVKNGAELGTAGSSQRLEELVVKIVKQPEITRNPTIDEDVSEDDVTLNDGIFDGNAYEQDGVTYTTSDGETSTMTNLHGQVSFISPGKIKPQNAAGSTSKGFEFNNIEREKQIFTLGRFGCLHPGIMGRVYSDFLWK